MSHSLRVPDDLYYLVPRQVWARLDAPDMATVGITELGIQLSGEVFMCRPKRVGMEIEQGGTVAVVELSKAIVAVKSAVSGVVVAGNPALRDRPRLVDEDPYGAGWIARLRLRDFARDAPQLLNGEAARTAMAAHAREHADALIPEMIRRRPGQG